MLMSAFIGIGSQMAVMGLIMIVYIILGQSYSERATIMTASIGVYVLTATVSGYTSAKFYATYGGKDWVRNVILTAILLPVSGVLIGGYINTLAIYYSSSRAVPFMALFSVIALWLLVVFPLTILGAIVARRWSGTNAHLEFPTRVNPIPRPIPEKLWYQEPFAIAAMGGLLPFASIFIEMYFIFTSFWTYKIYYVYGFMFLVFLILLVVSACVSIVSTYFLLNSEDHRW
jgi:transmembrane 9 superfamily protein 3